MFPMAKLSTSHGFTKGVSVDVLYWKINYVLENNPLYVQSNFTCNLDPAIILRRLFCLSENPTIQKGFQNKSL